MENKLLYREFCKKENSLPIFSQDWWLDSVCGEYWDVCIVKNDNEILATMPYFTKKFYTFNFISMPLLTQNLGPWFKTIKTNNSKVLSQQKEWMESLINQLPKYDYFKQNWHYSKTNWLPFYWKGFNATIKYTYVIEDLSNLNSVWNNIQDNIKYDVRKAQNKIGLKIRSDLPIDDFIKLNDMTFYRQKKQPPYSKKFLKELILNLKKEINVNGLLGKII